MLAHFFHTIFVHALSLSRSISPWMSLSSWKRRESLNDTVPTKRKWKFKMCKTRNKQTIARERKNCWTRNANRKKTRIIITKFPLLLAVIDVVVVQYIFSALHGSRDFFFYFLYFRSYHHIDIYHAERRYFIFHRIRCWCCCCDFYFCLLHRHRWCYQCYYCCCYVLESFQSIAIFSNGTSKFHYERVIWLMECRKAAISIFPSTRTQLISVVAENNSIIIKYAIDSKTRKKIYNSRLFGLICVPQSNQCSKVKLIPFWMACK